MESGGRFTERESLRTAAYVDETNLAARQAIYHYVEKPWPSTRGRVLGALDLSFAEVVVDVGCGNGNDVRDLKADGFEGSLLGFDLSEGMLGTVASLGVPVALADAASLPLPDAIADVALAMHMLYHCPDIAATVRELRRIVRPGGALVVSTNATAHLQELRELWTAVLSDVLGEAVEPWRTAAGRFPLEDAEATIAAAFDHVELQRTDNRLRVPEVGPVVAYVASTRDLSSHHLTDDVWRSSIQRLATSVQQRIDRDGAFEATVVKGIVVAR